MNDKCSLVETNGGSALPLRFGHTYSIEAVTFGWNLSVLCRVPVMNRLIGCDILRKEFEKEFTIL